jgi:hypothetical protein
LVPQEGFACISLVAPGLMEVQREVSDGRRVLDGSSTVYGTADGRCHAMLTDNRSPQKAVVEAALS